MKKAIKCNLSKMETLKYGLVVVLVSGLVSGCLQDLRIVRRYSVFIEDLFGGTSLMIKVMARGVGDYSILRLDRVC